MAVKNGERERERERERESVVSTAVRGGLRKSTDVFSRDEQRGDACRTLLAYVM